MNRGYFLGPDQGNTLNLLTDCDRLCHVIHILYLDRIKQEQYSVPPYFYNHVEDVTCGYGHVATLHCDVTGQPEPRVSWFKQERNAPLRETPGKFALRKQCERVTLIIYDVTTEDIGCYTCKIWNELGEAQSTGRLFYSPSPDRTINDNGSCLKKVIIKETVKIVKREQDALSCHAVVAPGFNTQPQDGSRRDSITIHFPLLE
uniref:Ig-like domain-containing protein n=1 Tax=Ciona intestinalis TaxID=7719 RepID=H2XNI5_CIOIN